MCCGEGVRPKPLPNPVIEGLDGQMMTPDREILLRSHVPAKIPKQNVM
jgi:hypothetical protein